jgi:hypothetical protein
MKTPARPSQTCPRLDYLTRALRQRKTKEAPVHAIGDARLGLVRDNQRSYWLRRRHGRHRIESGDGHDDGGSKADPKRAANR